MVACAYNPLGFTNERKQSNLSFRVELIPFNMLSTFIHIFAQNIVLFFFVMELKSAVGTMLSLSTQLLCKHSVSPLSSMLVEYKGSTVRRLFLMASCKMGPMLKPSQR